MATLNIQDVEWITPPTSRMGGGNGQRQSYVRDFVALLQLRPGQWAKYPRLTKAGLSTSTFRDMGYDNVEATTRVVKVGGERLVETYARIKPSNNFI